MDTNPWGSQRWATLNSCIKKRCWGLSFLKNNFFYWREIIHLLIVLISLPKFNAKFNVFWLGLGVVISSLLLKVKLTSGFSWEKNSVSYSPVWGEGLVLINLFSFKVKDYIYIWSFSFRILKHFFSGYSFPFMASW